VVDVGNDRNISNICSLFHQIVQTFLVIRNGYLNIESVTREKATIWFD
jgi:hypothetical protein